MIKPHQFIQYHNQAKRIKTCVLLAKLTLNGVMKAQENGTMFSKIRCVFTKVTYKSGFIVNGFDFNTGKKI